MRLTRQTARRLPAALLAASAWIAPLNHPVANAAAPDQDDSVDVLCLATDRPTVIRLRVTVDGRGFRAGWREYVERLFVQLDTDGDGELNPHEAQSIRAPDARLMVGAPAGEGAASLQETIDTAPADGRITRQEFSDYFAQSGDAALKTNLIGRMTPTNPGMQNDVDRESQLARRLDLDANGKLSALEFTDGARALALLDLDDDGTFNRSELAALSDPYGALSQQVTQAPGESLPFLVLSGAGSLDQIVQRLLMQFDKPEPPAAGVVGGGERPILDHRLSRQELALANATFDHFDLDGDGQLDEDELREFARRPLADLDLTIRLGQRQAGEALTEMTGAEGESDAEGSIVRMAADGTAAVVFDAVQIEIGSDGADRDPRAAKNAFLGQFDAADKDQNDYLEAGEARQTPFADRTFEALDRDGDGKLFRAEALAWFEDREASAHSRVALTISESGRNLFGIIDSNRDGRVSARELAAAVRRIPLWDADGDGELSFAEIPNHFRIGVGRDQPSLPTQLPANAVYAMPAAQAARPLNQGPAWFQKMDRNGDGEISAREFLATAELFKKLDANGDGAIDPDEAAAAQ